MQVVVKHPLVASGLFAATLLVSSCAPQTDPGTKTTDHAQPPVLRRGLGGEPATLDPAQAADNPGLTVIGDLFEGLTTAAADGSIVPGAAESWSATGDGLGWTFRLRSGLKWSNGEALDADDFRRALAALRTPGSTAPYASLLDDVTALQVIDDRTLTIATQRPLPQLPAILALPFASPQYAGPQARQSVSNGPYRLVVRTPGEALQLQRNPHFHAAGSVQVARVHYLTVADLGTELNLYRAGDLDVTSEIPNAQLEWIRANLPGQLHVAPFLSTYGYAVNLRRIPADAARLALALAVDRQRIVTMVTGAGELPAYSWVPPGIAGYAPASFSWQDLPSAARQAEAARLWSNARQVGGLPDTLRLCTDASANHRRTAVALADEWRRVLGIETEIVEFEWKAYLAQREEPGDCDLLRFGWSADYVDPEAFLALFVSGHAQNVGGYASPRYDALLREAASATDPAQRNALLALAEQRLLAEGAVIPIFHRVTKRLVKPHVAGVTPNPLGQLHSRYLRLQPAKK